MPEKNERYDDFAVPRNFGEDGISFNGLSRRNLSEGCILAAATGYPIAFQLSADFSLRIILLCFVSLPLFFRERRPQFSQLPFQVRQLHGGIWEREGRKRVLAPALSYPVRSLQHRGNQLAG